MDEDETNDSPSELLLSIGDSLLEQCKFLEGKLAIKVWGSTFLWHIEELPLGHRVELSIFIKQKRSYESSCRLNDNLTNEGGDCRIEGRKSGQGR